MLAGQVHSLDTWKDFIAVGSSVVQVIKLNTIGDPKRTLYIKGKNKLSVGNYVDKSMYAQLLIILLVLQHTKESDGSSSYSPLLVSFVGDSGVLASATVDEDTVDIWDPPSADQESLTSKVVTKPKSTIILADNENIVRYIDLIIILLYNYSLVVNT